MKMSGHPVNQTAIPVTTLKNQVGFSPFCGGRMFPSGEGGVPLGMSIEAFNQPRSLDFLAEGNTWAAFLGLCSASRVSRID